MSYYRFGLDMFTEMNEVNYHLFIGNARCVTEETLRENRITCVINCSNSEPTYPITSIKYVPLEVDDSNSENIGRYFDEITDLIYEEHQRNGITLVHCTAGISRSATLCIAYLMKYENYTLRNAFKHLKSRRRVVHPNNGFFQQLIDFERRLYHRTSVKMVKVPNIDIPDYYVPDVYYEISRGMVWLRSVKSIFRR